MSLGSTPTAELPLHVPYEEKQSRSAFLRKLSFYLFGIAIGFVLLGIFQQQRKASLQKQAEAQRLQEEAAKKNPSPFPPLPSESPHASPQTPPK